VSLFPKPGGYTNLAWVDYCRTLTERVQAIPGIVSAGLVHTRPANLLEWTEKIRVSKTSGDGIRADVEMLMPGAFQALGIGQLCGRTFTWQDNDRSPRVAIVSKNLADQLFARASTLGRRVDITSIPNWRDLEIVGVVTNASLYDLRKHDPATLYLPSTQYGDYMGYSDLFVQTNVGPMRLAGSIRRIVGSLDHEYVASIRTIEEEVDRSIYRERITAMLSAFFGALALMLAGSGLYGLIAFNITRRTREIAIRIAIGAPRNTVQTMVIREAFVLAAAGIAIGLPCSIACGKLISGMLYGVSAHDPFTVAVVSLMLLAVAALAAFAPARTATRLDPIVALRRE
jgi:predicted permease